MNEIKNCPWCGSEAIVYPFISRIQEVPKPIKLFGRWSLIKMSYKDIPKIYEVECSKFCDGYAEFGDLYAGKTIEEAVEKWNTEAKA